MRGNAVGEIHGSTTETVSAVFLGVESPVVSLSRSVLEAAGILVVSEEFFVAEVELDAQQPGDLQPSGFAPLPRQSDLDTEVRELWAR